MDFALPQWAQDANFQIEDAYKWIFQATRGGEHAAPSREMAREYLNEEWQTLAKPSAGEALWQPLCADGEIGRLNLRPFRARGGNAEKAADAFVKSSLDFQGTEKDFLAAWRELGKRLRKKRQGNLSYKTWRHLDSTMRKQKYPAIHHSKIYEDSEHPAYRILTKAEFEKLSAALK